MNEQGSTSNLRNKVVAGLAWSYAERILAQGVSFIVSLILARILDPEHYGVVAVVTIFINIFNIFVTSGLGSSLVQKKDSDDLDFSTAFSSGIALSIIFYLILFLISPIIAGFFIMPQLAPLLRVLGLRIIIASINTVQHAYVSKHLIFKKFFFSTLFGTIVSAVVGVVMACNGFGAWSLIGQYMTNTIIDTIVLFVILPWKPNFIFSYRRFTALFSFGWKILISDLIQTIYNDLRSLAIGKKYSSSDLSFYNKGQQFTSIIVKNIDAALIKVLFPAISKYQDNKDRVREITRRAIKVSSFVMSPLLIGLAVVSKQVILLLLTDKWLGAVPYLQLLCVANLFQPMHSSNLQAIKAIGRSDITLKLEIVKKTYGVIILVISIVFFNTPLAVAAGFVLSTLISIFVNAIPNKKLLSYGYAEQLSDIFPHLLLSGLMGVAVFFIGLLKLAPFAVLLIQIVVGATIYISLSYIFKIDSFAYLIKLLHERKSRRNNQANY